MFQSSFLLIEFLQLSQPCIIATMNTPANPIPISHAPQYPIKISLPPTLTLLSSVPAILNANDVEWLTAVLFIDARTL
jgi:hypothetical protein